MPVKFSLKAIFAFITLTCLAALIFQQLTHNMGLKKEINLLNVRIASHEPRLAKDVPIIKRSVGQPSRYSKTHQKTVKKFDESIKKLIAEGKQSSTLSITHVPSLKTDDVQYLIAVPDGLKCKLSIQTIEDDKTLPVFAPPPKDLDLPQGLSTLKISQTLTFTQGRTVRLSFTLNDKTTYSTICDTVLFTDPRFVRGTVNPDKNHDLFVMGLMDINELWNGRTSLKCQLKVNDPEGTEGPSSPKKQTGGSK